MSPVRWWICEEVGQLILRGNEVEELKLQACLTKSAMDPVSSVAVIDLSDNVFNSKLPNSLFNVSSLVYVDVSRSHIKGQIPSTIVRLRNLKFLICQGPIANPIKLSFPLSIDLRPYIGKLTEYLNFLSLAGNQLTGEIPASIGGLQGLKIIDLSRNNLSGRIPSSIGRCYWLEVLDLQNNNLSGVIPESLGAGSATLPWNTTPQ
ncbi:hypothetical protein GH714_002084 [Hevea brasiliensis]|uniref:Leucine-rich repeat-containing N-terminal plant-type domain-containing protein n=1 Tax=Hevea brasiliensis TaxID=3981 RepID=A0A6A6KWR6_HEVBR|nr:hypothetical protein GH714_002084 [Hevea brasiliensis]